MVGVENFPRVIAT